MSDETLIATGTRRNVRWWLFAAGVAATLLLVFFAASALGLAIDDTAPMGDGGVPAAVIGVVLLIADAVLPVPSSLIMIAHGKLFGVATGALLSLAGSVGSALAAFAIGRAGTRGIRRLVLPEGHDRASALLARWGLAAVAVTRPVPILAETVAILAGSSRLGWLQTALAAAAGSILPAMVYAWAGAHARSANHAVVVAGVLLVTAGLWWVGARQKR
ncbi:MAG TPA: VTT domain-containing protein [Thermoanaerobaculia bacterium]|nr:VTT domain-containing protein [Thermoanaerobaculia bacterium]